MGKGVLPGPRGRHRLPRRQRRRHPARPRRRQQHEPRDGPQAPGPGPEGARKILAGGGREPRHVAAGGGPALGRRRSGGAPASEACRQNAPRRICRTRRKGALRPRGVLVGRRHTGQGEGGALGGEERDGVQEPPRIIGRHGVGELPPRAEARLGVRVRRPAVTQGGRRAAGAVLQPGEAGARPTGRRNPQDSGRRGESDSRSRPKRRRAGEPRGAQDPIRGRGARRIVEGDMRRRPRPPGGGRPKRRARGLRAAHRDPPREAPRAPARRRTFEARAQKGGGEP